MEERRQTASVLLSRSPSRIYLGGRDTMIRNEDLMQLLLCYGRGMSQDFVTKSDNINDVIYYLRAECEFEILKLTSFVTTNLIHFEKRTVVLAH